MERILTRGRPVGFPDPGQTVAVLYQEGVYIEDVIAQVHPYNAGYGRSIVTKRNRHLSFRYYWEPIYTTREQNDQSRDSR